jgi:flagellar assembly protein FliH
MATTTRKFTFDHDFGPPPAAPLVRAEPVAARIEPDEDAPPPPPSFSEEELNLAREAAYEDGRQHGHAEAHDAINAHIAATLNDLGQQIVGLQRIQTETNEEIRHDSIRLAFAVLKKMLPAACTTHAFEEVAHVIEEVVGHLLDEPRIIVRVATDLVEPLRGRLEEVADAHGFEGRVVVQADARLVAGDCKVEWADGGAERDQARLMAEIEATIERAVTPPAGMERDFAGT